MSNFPKDSDGLALQKMAASGMNMNSPVGFEFYIHVESKQQANAISNDLQEARVGDEIGVVYDEGELGEGEEMTEENKVFWPSWSVYVYYKMIPDYHKTVEFQDTLERLSEPYGGKPDGWGCHK